MTLLPLNNEPESSLVREWALSKIVNVFYRQVQPLLDHDNVYFGIMYIELTGLLCVGVLNRNVEGVFIVTYTSVHMM